MSIAMIIPVPAGAALRLLLKPSRGASSWRVLRRMDDAFAGPDDPGAMRVFESAVETSFVDVQHLQNGTAYHYCLYEKHGADWRAGTPQMAVPAFTLQDEGVDVLALVLDRLDAGFRALIAEGSITPASGRIAVLNAPPVFDETSWPVITAHLGGDSSAERGLGDMAGPDAVLDRDVVEHAGWLSSWSLSIVAWSLNPDERMLLRRLVRAIVIGNLEVFEDLGIHQVDLSQEDVEDFTSFDAPVYQCVSTFRCMAPAVVSRRLPRIADVIYQHRC